MSTGSRSVLELWNLWEEKMNFESTKSRIELSVQMLGYFRIVVLIKEKSSYLPFFSQEQFEHSSGCSNVEANRGERQAFSALIHVIS
jgi:hypothetical protein